MFFIYHAHVICQARPQQTKFFLTIWGLLSMECGIFYYLEGVSAYNSRPYVLKRIYQSIGVSNTPKIRRIRKYDTDHLIQHASEQFRSDSNEPFHCKLRHLSRAYCQVGQCSFIWWANLTTEYLTIKGRALCFVMITKWVTYFHFNLRSERLEAQVWSGGKLRQ